MKILFSYPTKIENESALINELMSSDKWDIFHLRKPSWSDDEVEKLFKKLKDEVKAKTVLHSNFKGSCHSFEEVEELNESFCHPEFIEGKETGDKSYCFLSPIFDSISKPGYKANFNKEALKQFLKKERQIKVIALGGVTDENYKELIDMGFDGGAFLGSVWNSLLESLH